MKEFCLEAALAGAKVCTRDGKEVTQLTKFSLGGDFMLAGVVNNQIMRWYKGGISYDDSGDWSLYMAPTKKTGWVARLSEGGVAWAVLSTESECKAWYPNAHSYHEITWEE